jgi:peptidoglycan/xylan/chitin deacetylase (PgdA/CDA1 family)
MGEMDLQQDKPLALSRKIAITVDDLPAVRGGTLQERERITASLVKGFQGNKIKAVGFVNERKLGEPSARSEEVELLKLWINAGMELGNHTYSHPNLFVTPTEQYIHDIKRGSVITAKLLEQSGSRLKFFRHPFLNTGSSSKAKAEVDQFLEAEGYIVAPVTIDNSEWIYADAYDVALKRYDLALAATIAESYILYMQSVFDFYEHLSHDIFGREPAQILLIHANKLNADSITELIKMIHGRGYDFISLQEALDDPAYLSVDDYIGEAGISWLQRWWITKGKVFRAEPEVPGWIEAVRAQQPASISNR